VNARLVLEGEIAFEAPFAIGGAEPSFDSDRPVLLDADGVPALPGTSLAGSLRSLLERLAPSLEASGLPGGELVMELFGTALDNPEEADEEAEAREGSAAEPAIEPSRPSRLRVFDATPVHVPPVSLRDGVGIDRASGSARGAIKYDLEVAGQEGRYGLRMEVDLDGEQDPVNGCLALLAMGLNEWEHGRGALGGRVGSGLGAFRLTGLRARRIELAGPEHRETLRHWLRARPDGGERTDPNGQPLGEEWQLPTLAELVRAGRLGVTGQAPDGSWPGSLRLTMELDTAGPFLVGGITPIPEPGRSDHAKEGDDAPADASRSDAQALTRPAGDGEEPILPGSSLRGVLRTRAERIVRYLGGDGLAGACDPFETPETTPPSPRLACGRRPLPEDFKKRFDVENRRPAERRGREAERAKVLRGNLSCPVCRLFGSTHLGGRVRVEERPVSGARVELLDHVAIDRFTGGAADAKKFDAAPLLDGGVRTAVHLDRPEAWEVALLLLALRDLAEGWVPVGSRGTRGYGRVRGRLVELEALTVPDAEAPLAPLCRTDAGPWRWGRYTFDGDAFLGRTRAWDWLEGEPAVRALLERGLADLEKLAKEWNRKVLRATEGRT
jgi:CRISPR/Cas system CSM-associated protein Csm3 (group 7 of RAMP superfamily)